MENGDIKTAVFGFKFFLMRQVHGRNSFSDRADYSEPFLARLD
jgi:hypothetical protein